MTDQDYKVGDLRFIEAVVAQSYVDGFRMGRSYQDEMKREEVNNLEERIEDLEEIAMEGGKDD